MTKIKITSKIDSSLHQQWLDKVWHELFDENIGLMAPGQIRREHRNRNKVRQQEMAAILRAEEELNDVHEGLKELDDNGHLINTPSIGNFATYDIIENTAIDQGLDVGIDTSETMIRSVVKEVSIRDLERALNIRKIAILAESEALASHIEVVSDAPVNAEWMRRWRECAESIFNPELQLLWAKTLIYEVAVPGTFSLGMLASLHQLDNEDLEIVKVAAKYTFLNAIFNASDGYFNTDFHQNLFEVLEDIALLHMSEKTITLSSDSTQAYHHLLAIGHKALKLIANNPLHSVEIPILKLTRVGRQVFSLFDDTEADSAYVFDLAGYIKKQGVDVVIGEIKVIDGSKQFIERVQL